MKKNERSDIYFMKRKSRFGGGNGIIFLKLPGTANLFKVEKNRVKQVFEEAIDEIEGKED